ncbi:TonB-dependent receptor [Sphingomonas sp. CROZ-RG-20F-R02-07]|uniref:TonB-dependent receptor domain-containing protein n=1 Tax=Sphingomonas sp. CROZ-RG-20F-R02-07 TaxID=2914832 RepID=UPI001F5AF11E|nr:TonB-dependent receptor [Sphingomonas sp. CROZ-RG-20F-R02-07]
MTTSFRIARTILQGGSALPALALFGAGAMLATPALAQDATTQNPPASTVTGAATLNNSQTNPDTATSQGTSTPADIVVTGSLFRRADTETASPVTVLTTENLQRAGITNVADAIRSISADNSGSIPTAFSAGFGSGSAAVSLRGLSVNSTLVLIDGVRTTNYPFSDDGQRAFVDLNSIPKSTIDRIEVLKDGASSTYGADAIGGVVNIITRKEIKGIEGTVEGGISERGDGGERRATLTAGYGDLTEQRFNVYINGEYERDNLIQVSDRGFPYNTNDLTSIGGDNNNSAALGAFGNRTASISAVVQPAIQTVPGNIFSGQPVVGVPTQVLAPGGCAVGTIARNDSSGAFCEQNATLYGTIQPQQTRYGFTAHGTVKIGDNAEAYFNGTYYHSSVFSTAAPFSIRQTNPISTSNILLPALLANGRLNPQNPYAAEGLGAQISYAFGDIPVSSTTDNDLYRAAAGISGKFGTGWSYSADASYAKSDLTGTNRGYLNIAGLTAAINNGTYNFIDPSQNSQALRDSISQPVVTKASSELYMLQGNITKELFQLPGGPLQVGIGGAVRHESLNNPNANANLAYLGLNAVTARGSQTVTAGYFEIDAPVLTQLELTGSGRYDHYSEGYGRFSPKVGAKFQPFKQLAIRGTYSQGFRAPSFAESQSGSVIGYVNATPPASVIAAHNGDPYVSQYSFGYNTASNPNLKPELSRSFTGGVILQPLSWLSMTADYYNIKKTQVITGGPLAATAVANYYAGTALPAGYTVTLDDADPLAPNAIRKVLIVNSLYQNAASLKTSGIDASIQANFRMDNGFRFTSRFEGTEILDYKFQASDDSPTDNYVGTQAPYQTSSGAGTPRWRANWQNTAEYGPYSLSATGYYTSGYKSVAVDYNGSGATTCSDQLYDPSLGNSFCHTKGYFQLDLVGQVKVNAKFTFYINALNILDAHPPLNPANYAAVNYNPTWSQGGIVGRYFRAGANFKF